MLPPPNGENAEASIVIDKIVKKLDVTSNKYLNCMKATQPENIKNEVINNTITCVAKGGTGATSHYWMKQNSSILENKQKANGIPVQLPDKSMLKIWEKYLLSVRKAGSSCGAIIEVRANGVPAGLGAPIYSKLDSDIASAMMSINAVKGVNIGSGMNSAQLSGEENSDEISQTKKKLKFNSNNAGGILGGISSGQEIIVSFAVKPTSSILKSRKTVNKLGKNTTISVKGRHDPCVGIRAVPVGEAMLSCVLLDHYLMHKAQCS